MEYENNSNRTMIESWFIPMDILMIICTFFSVILALSFSLIIILKKSCHTVPMMLVANSCLSEFVYGSNMLAMAVFTFHNDVRQIEYQDSLCYFRGYFAYVVTALQNYSYLLQAVYRYIILVYPTRLFFQSLKFQIFLICLKWIFSFLCAIPYILLNEIIYNIDNQICQMPFRFSLITVYNALCVYMIPISLIVFIYFKLVRYVKGMGKNVTPVNTLLHAERELKMVRQIVILVVGVVTIGFPYTMFVILSFFTPPPQYHYRIAYIFVDVALAFVMIALFQFTEPIKSFLTKKLNLLRNRVTPIFK